MKVIFLSLVCVGLFAGQAKQAWAQDEPLTPEMRRQQLQEAADQARENRQVAKEEIRENRQDVRSDVAQIHAARLKRRFDFYTRRLTTIINKFETRLEMMDANGTDVAAAQAKLTQAKDTLALAQIEAANAVADFQAIQPENYQGQRDSALAASEIAKQARQLFRQVVSLLKETLILAQNAQE